MNDEELDFLIEVYRHTSETFVKRQDALTMKPQVVSDFLGIKFRTFSPLQQKVYELGICAKCHKKTMYFIMKVGGMDFWQCSVCRVVAILSASASVRDEF